MCFYFQMSVDAQTLENRFQKKMNASKVAYTKNIVNGFEHPKVAIITYNKPEIVIGEWGLLPNWAKDKSFQKSTLNAKIETLSERPSFKKAIQNRCLVPATGFYEWKWLDAKGKIKERYLIKHQQNPIFSFAGITSDWVDFSTGEVITTFSILTTQANELMSEIHNTKQRMPVILHPNDESNWLNGADYHQFDFPYQVQLVAEII